MTTIIRPGILVSLKSTVAGGVSYSRRDLENATDDGGAARQKWETEKIVEDPEEHAKATKARGDALSAIRKNLYHTAFGLVCPAESETFLDEGVRTARRIVDEFNATAKTTRVAVYCLKGRIAGTDEEAARAIGSEIAGLIAAMDRGIAKLDPDAIRDAANKLTSMSAMLSDEQASKAGDAIKQARAAARTIVRLGRKGEEAAVILADIQRGAIEKARIAFLDLDDAPAVEGQAMPVVDVGRVAALDVEEDEPRSEPAPEQTGGPAETLAASAGG